MDLAIIIGFKYEYLGTMLPSTVVDIYRVTEYVESSTKIVLSDWLLSGNTLTKPCKIKSNWEAFCRGETATWYHVLGEKSLVNALRCISGWSKFKRVMIYYTGHGSYFDSEYHIEFPNGKTITHIEFRNIFLPKVSPNCQVLFIMDCCSASSFGLPFRFIDGKFSLNEKTFISRDILYISSCQSSGESIANKKYSYFTKYLFETLEESDLCLDKLILTIESRLLRRTQQRINIYSSYNRLSLLWPWVVRRPDYNIKIYPKYIIMSKKTRT